MSFNSKLHPYPLNNIINTSETDLKPQVSVIVPIYNGENTAPSMIANIKQVLNELFQNYEIIAVDDGSYDNTSQLLLKEQKLDPHVRVISYHKNMGKGHAVKIGVVKSCGNIVIFIDSDLEISARVIADFINELQRHDIIIGHRWHRSSTMLNVPLSRRVLSRGFNLLVRISTGINIHDTQAGLKAGNGALLRKIFKVVTTSRYAFDVELLTIAHILDLDIKEVPIIAECKPGRNITIRDIVKMASDVGIISYRARVRKWYQKRLLSELKNA